MGLIKNEKPISKSDFIIEFKKCLRKKSWMFCFLLEISPKIEKTQFIALTKANKENQIIYFLIRLYIRKSYVLALCR